MDETLNDKLVMSDIIAVIVTFFPDSKFIERLQATLAQVKKVIIVNNGARHSLPLEIGSLSLDKQVFLIQNPRNLGIAKALNQGIAYAMSEGYKWVWLFDQDTLVPQGVLRKLRNCYDETSSKQKVGLIAPNFYDPSLARYGADLNNSGIYFEVSSAISSGSLMTLEVFSEIGWFNEKFFIDCVDDEYCLRMREKQYKIILVKDAIINHTIGAGTRHKIFNKSFTTTNHSPVRRYFWSRNGFSLVLKYIIKEPRIALGICKSHILTMIILLIFEERKIEKFKYLSLGVFDGLINNFDRSLTIGESS